MTENDRGVVDDVNVYGRSFGWCWIIGILRWIRILIGHCDALLSSERIRGKTKKARHQPDPCVKRFEIVSRASDEYHFIEGTVASLRLPGATRVASLLMR
jgi:hypothetical protein